MKSLKYLAQPLLALAVATPLLLIGCKGDTPNAPSPTFTITATPGDNGSISPAGVNTVRKGATIAYTVTPSGGYQLDTVTVDGKDVTAVYTALNGYTFINVSAAHTIAATFKVIPPIAPELIVNGDMETADPGNAAAPSGWLQGGWGTNTKTETWESSGGHSGSHFLRVNMTAFTDGDAKWWQAVPVSEGNTYTYTEWYRCNLASAVSIEWQDADGGHVGWDWGPPTAAAAADWTKYTYTSAAVPAGATKMVVYHTIAGIGTLDKDDVSTKIVVP